MTKNNESFVVRYSYGAGRNFGKAKNTSKSLKSFRLLFKNPTVTNERFKDYLRLPEKDQGHLKSIAGWFYRTQVDGKVRNRGSGLPSDLLSFDFDYATPEFLQTLTDGGVMTGYEWFLHTSRRHTDEKPRFRLFVFLSEPVPNDLYGPVSRIIAQKFDPDMIHVDKVSFRPAQMMFMPTISKDGDFVFHENNGELLDWSEALDTYELTKGDWRDITQLPQADGENAREVLEKAEDPTEKPGIVGNFCRAYDVEAAIEARGLKAGVGQGLDQGRHVDPRRVEAHAHPLGRQVRPRLGNARGVGQGAFDPAHAAAAMHVGDGQNRLPPIGRG